MVEKSAAIASANCKTKYQMLIPVSMRCHDEKTLKPSSALQSNADGRAAQASTAK
jgi:hypothetical protein